MSFLTYESKNLQKTVSDTSFYHYLTGNIIDSNNEQITSLYNSSSQHITNSITGSLLNKGEDYISSEWAKANADYDMAQALYDQNQEVAKNLTPSQFNDDNIDFPVLQLDIPHYSIENYIADRTRFVKGVTSVGDEVGWFYFKVFFKFNTNYGLFGSVLRDANSVAYFPSNCALKYLWAIHSFYDADNISDRILALYKFTDMLSDICTNSPWLFKGVNGLTEAMKTYTTEFSKEKKVELIFNDERTDMRIGTLLNLYRFLCYDDINCKEIIPENLRKFDMCISLFHVPIKYFQTGIMVSPKKNLATGLFSGTLAKVESIIEKTVNFLTTKAKYYKYKTMYPENGNFSNMFSFKLFTFSNCEFDVDSFGKYFEGSQIDNSTAFNLGKGMALSIKYDRVYYSEMNEWNQFMFGSMGFEYNAHNEEFKERYIKFPDNFGLIRSEGKNYWNERLESLKEGREGAQFYDSNAEQYKALIDYSESLLVDGLMSMDMEDYYSYIKGNIYGGSALLNSQYWKAKMKALKTGSVDGNIYGKDLSPSLANLGSGVIGLEDGYFKEKIKHLKNGSVGGNLYGKKLSPREKEADGSGYFTKKIQSLVKGKITGNLYDRIYGVIHEYGDNASAENSDYLAEKLRVLSGKAEAGSIGHLYGDEVGIIGPMTDLSKREKSKYLEKKVKMIKDGTLKGRHLYGDVVLEGPTNDMSKRVKSKFYQEKLDHMLKPKDLGSIYELDPSKDLASFIASTEAGKPIITNNTEGIESLSTLEYRNALNNSDTGTVGFVSRDNTNIDEKLAETHEFSELVNNNGELNGGIISDINSAPKNSLTFEGFGWQKEAYKKAPNDIEKHDQKILRKREIWNYQLTGKPKGSLGGLMDAASDIASFFKW